MPVPTLTWENDALRLIDQTSLPEAYPIYRLSRCRSRGRSHCQLAGARRACHWRGSGLWGRHCRARSHSSKCRLRCTCRKEHSKTRPNAAHSRQPLLGHSSGKKTVVAEAAGRSPAEKRDLLLKEAQEIFEDDKRICRQIGRHGAELLSSRSTVLTHCNAGGLATADYGTALAVVYAAVEAGKQVAVYADETRPLLQGSAPDRLGIESERS